MSVSRFALLKCSWGCKDNAVKFGFTIGEMLITMLITTIVATLFALGISRLLKVEESNRQEGYIRERLTMITSSYADYLSMGSSLALAEGPNHTKVYQTYFPMETGGVSFETGKVVRVVGMATSVSNGLFNVCMNTAGRDSPDVLEKHVSGAAELVPVLAMITDVMITSSTNAPAVGMVSIVASNTVYNVKRNRYEPKLIVSKRLFRLWNSK